MIKKVNKMTVEERIEALKQAGVDVSHLFSMKGAAGGEMLASNANGKLTIVQDDDPIYGYIKSQGDIPNRQLFRRWVMSQMFHILAQGIENKNRRACRPTKNTTEVIRGFGYEYQWKMTINELYAQMKMFKNGDMVNFNDRNLWFNKEVVLDMIDDYIVQLSKKLEKANRKNCKGVPYIKVGGQNVFVEDVPRKIFRPLNTAKFQVLYSSDPETLYYNIVKFNNTRLKVVKKIKEMKQAEAWLNAYKGSGAYFTMQNMIRFHGCVFMSEKGTKLSKSNSLQRLTSLSKKYYDEGWRMIGVLKQMLLDNNIDIEKKMSEWKKR